jgi:hypothetical protein
MLLHMCAHTRRAHHSRQTASRYEFVRAPLHAELISGILTYADVCWRMLTYADVCGADISTNSSAPLCMRSLYQVYWRMLTHAGRMLTYADVRWRMRSWYQHLKDNHHLKHAYADVCWRMLTYADVCGADISTSRTTTTSSMLDACNLASSSKASALLWRCLALVA